MTIDLWSVESQLYALIDAKKMKGNSRLIEIFNLGSNHFVDVNINNFSRTRISTNSVINAREFIFTLNFRKGSNVWFRIDNTGKNYLHFHLQSKNKSFKKHQPLKEDTVYRLISSSFDWLYKLLKEKFPDEIIADGPGYVSFA